MTTSLQSKTLSTSIECSKTKVYDFVSNPESLPHWASGLCQPIRKVGADWVATTTSGDVVIEFIARNEFGVLDHRVRLGDDIEVVIPMRVVDNGHGCVVIFTLFRMPNMSDDLFANDIQAVEGDLRTLKRVMESQAQ